VQVVGLGERVLPGRARNIGVAQSKGGILAFLDADADASLNWLDVMSQVLEASPDVDLVGGWVANANPEAAASRTLHWIEFSEFLPGLPSGIRKRLSSSNWLIRRKAFERTGGFEEEGLSEDTILCEKLAGGVTFESRAGVSHHHREDWATVELHLRSLGYHGGRFRRRFSAGGAWLRRLPFLSFALPLYRGPKIIARAFRSNWKEGFRCLIESPMLLVGLWHWTLGFYRGIKGSSISDFRPSNGANSPGQGNIRKNK
jgi:hypothetical protein